jgi:hypothetical protein
MTKDKSIPSEFIVTIPTRNDRGEVTGEKQFVVYAGLLAVAHEIGLDQIHATVLQMPTEQNGMTAVVRAVVQGKRGTFSGLGDASPQSVNARVVRHLLRVAETRAKARALRDFCNIGLVALEELGDDELDLRDARQGAAAPRSTGEEQRHTAGPRAPAPMTDPQRRALWRKALALGFEGEAAREFLVERLGADPEKVTKEQASRLLDELSAEERRHGNGAGNAAE